MVYKGEAVDVKRVGREQGVRYVLEGSVRKAGNRVRVTAQLIDAATGHHLWADRYDRELDDVFEVQDEITQQIIVEMHVQIAKGEQVRLWAGGTKSVEAWEYVVRGVRATNVREDNLETRRLANAALAIDPDFVAATVLLGYTHWLDAFWKWGESREESLQKALSCGNRGLELDEGHPDSRSLLSACASVRGDHERAIRLAEDSVNLSPSHAENTFMLGWVLRGAGQYPRAVERMKRAMRLSPRYPPTYPGIIGTCYHLMGQNDLAIPNLREAVRRIPVAVTYRAWLTSSLVEAGLSESKEVPADILTVDPGFSSRAWAETFGFFYDKGVTEQLLTNLLTAGLPE